MRLIRVFATPERLIPLSLFAGAIVTAALGAGIARALPSEGAETLPLSEVKPGMKGYGLTVFSGTTPEKFNVEVIATLHKFRPNQDLVIVKTLHPRLEITRTVGGMSGSPIFLNGKMMGAYAYGWLFGVEPIAGVTPIQSMLDDLARPVPKQLFPAAGGSPLGSGNNNTGASPLAVSPRSPRAFSGSPITYDLKAHAGELAQNVSGMLMAPQGSSLARAQTPIMLGGMASTAMRLANDMLAPMGLEPVQAGGGANKIDPDAPTKYTDGGGIGVQLVRGDMSAMGLGTVTRVSGDKLVAFGHPMLGGGIESLPTAIAKVHWFVASTSRSFKIGEAVRPLGALVNDRQAAIVVDASVKAPVFPVHVDVKGVPGVPKTSWDVEVTHDQFMAPMFTAMAIGNAVEETAAERRDMSYRAKTVIKTAKYGSLTIADFGAGAGNPVSADDFARSRAVRSIGALLNNPWESVVIESVSSEVRVNFSRDVSLLRGAKLLETEVYGGQSARIQISMQPYQGKIEHRTIEVKIPIELAGREVEIDLAPGYDVERTIATPDSIAGLVATLPNLFYDAESIVATIRLRENGAAYGGKVADRLPAFAIDTMRTVSQSDAPEVFASLSHVAIPIGRFLVGRDSVRVDVRRNLK